MTRLSWSRTLAGTALALVFCLPAHAEGPAPAVDGGAAAPALVAPEAGDADLAATPVAEAPREFAAPEAVADTLATEAVADTPATEAVADTPATEAVATPLAGQDAAMPLGSEARAGAMAGTDVDAAAAPVAELPVAELPAAEPPAAAPSIADLKGAIAPQPSPEAPRAVVEAPVPAPAKPAPATAEAKPADTQPVSKPAPAPAAVAERAIPAEALAAALKTVLDGADINRGPAEERRARAAITAFYAQRAYAPLFVDGKGQTARAIAAADRFNRAGEDGLDPAAYAVPAVKAEPTAQDLAAAELAFAEAAVRYARHAQSGRFDPLRLSELVTAKPPVTDAQAVMADLAGAADVSAALEAYNPPHEGYRRLKAKLAEFGAGAVAAAPQPVRVPEGPALKPGQRDERVAALRERLKVAGATVSDATVYDPSLVAAVKSFQRERGITDTGVVGPQTLAALNGTGGTTEVRAADIIANMERWRWLPRDLGSMHVFVNIPQFELGIVRNGKEIHRTRVIVGKVANQTPVFSETMTHIIVNPYWNVPVSILKKEMLGQIQETGGAYLDRGNYEVVVNSRAVPAASVDWTTVNPAAVRVRQRPGAGNALGNVKFMFPNQHSVYLHDTSSRGLFAQNYRALSHGCVRVYEPFAFADQLLSEEPTGLNGSKLKAMVGGEEKWLYLKRKIEVHLAYFTTWVADDGKLETRPDIYGHNGRTKQLLGL
jgi:murein L,D-transpeptidase YcbB/YkuD